MTKILQSRGIRGVLLPPRPLPMSHIRLDWDKFAAACIGHSLPAPKLHLAVAEHTRIIETALRMIKKYHYKRVGLAVFPRSDQYAQYTFSARFLFYQSLIPAADRVPPLYHPIMDEARFDDGHQSDLPKLAEWLERYQPEVILGMSPIILNWLSELKISVPGDVAYVDLCLPTTDGSCAGVFERPEVIAASAVDLLVEQIHHNERGVPKHPKSVAVEGVWIDGKTLPKR